MGITLISTGGTSNIFVGGIGSTVVAWLKLSDTTLTGLKSWDAVWVIGVIVSKLVELAGIDVLSEAIKLDLSE